MIRAAVLTVAVVAAFIAGSAGRKTAAEQTLIVEWRVPVFHQLPPASYRGAELDQLAAAIPASALQEGRK